jgi:carbamoyl-phosphate synthase large subunit
LSTNIHIIKNADALTKDILDDEKLLFMEYIDKEEYKEFTVDMYFGKDGCVKSIVPRERIEIRAGEVNKGINAADVCRVCQKKARDILCVLVNRSHSVNHVVHLNDVCSSVFVCVTS